MSAFIAKKVSGDELVELLGAELRMVQVELELVDEFLPTLSKNDPKYPVRMAGLDKMRQGLAVMCGGVLMTLTEEQYYRADTRAKLLAYCRETFPSILPKLSPPSQAEMLQRINDLVDDPRVRDLRPQLILLRDEVRPAAATTSAQP